MLRTASAVLALTVLAAIPAVQAAPGDEPPPASRDERYGNTPEEIVPYRDFGERHRDLFPEPLPFLGPGRDQQEPDDLTEVRIGLLVPGEGSPEAREGRGMRRGAILAIEEANAAGGYRGLPFVLMEHEDLPVWGASSNEIVAMAYEERVWAALGSVSGDSSHIAIRVALKAKLPVMNTATGDPTLTETAIPWAFRCIADDRQQGYALARHLFVERGLSRVAVLRANSRYGRMGIVELRDAARRLGRPVVSEVQWLAGTEDFRPLVERVLALEPDGLVVWGDAPSAGRALATARAMGLDVPAAGPSLLLSDDFLAAAGEAAEGFVAVATFDPTSEDPAWLAFREAYRERWEEEPDDFAAHAYDGMNLLVDAVREAGLNRVLIRDYLAGLERYHGATGEIVFDNTFNDVGPVYLAEVVEGGYRYRPEPANGPWSDEEREEPVTVGLLRALEGELAPAGRSAERGALLALEEADGSRALRLVSAEVRGPWSSVGEVARDLLETEGAAGLITVLDRAGSHVAAQVATKLRRPLVTTHDESALLRHTGVPWLRGPEAGDEAPAAFDGRYRERFGEAPDEAARAGYVAARRLLAVLAAGPVTRQAGVAP